MVVTAGAMAVGGGLLTVVVEFVVDSVTMVSACAGKANKADTKIHPLSVAILLIIFFRIGFANLLHVSLLVGTSNIFTPNEQRKCW